MTLFEGTPYLLVALGDGSLFYFVMNPVTKLLGDRKKVRSHFAFSYCQQAFKRQRLMIVGNAGHAADSSATFPVSVNRERICLLRPAHRHLFLESQASF